MKKVMDLRPCDNCGGAINLQFYLLRLSLAIVKAQAVNEFFGMHQFFCGKASPALVENFAPSSTDAVTIAGDAHTELMTEIVICSGCFLDKPIDLAMVYDRVHQRIRDAEEKSST